MSGVLQRSSRCNTAFWVGSGVVVLMIVAYGTVSAYQYLAAGRISTSAEVDFQHGQTAAARSKLHRLLWFHPQNPHANLSLGKIERAAGNVEQAVQCFRTISPEHNVHRLASLELARTLALDGQLNAAEEELEHYLRRYQATQSVWDLYFRLLYLQTRTRDVITLLDRKLAQNPESLADVRFLLKAEFVPQEPRETLDVLEAMNQRHPEDIDAQVALAIALSRTDDQARAEQLLRDVLDCQPDHHRARIVLAQWLANQQDFSTARDVLWQDPGYPDVQRIEGIHQDDRFWSLSSRLAEQAGNADLALQYIDHALQMRSNDKRYLTQRAQILRRLSKKEEAALAGERAVEAGRIEQQLFLLATEIEGRPVRVSDCRTAARLYQELGRPARAELWARLAEEIEQTEEFKSAMGVVVP